MVHPDKIPTQMLESILVQSMTFSLTSMASQLDSLSFINEGSTKRKEYLAKFLDLEIFDKKFKMAKEESAMTRMSLKKLEGIDFDEQILAIKKEITKSELAIESHKAQCKSMREELQQQNIGLKQLSDKIDAVPAEIIDPVLTQQEITRKEILVDAASKTRNIAQLAQDEEKYEMTDFLSTFDIQSYEDKKKLVEDKKSNSLISKRCLHTQMRNLGTGESRTYCQRCLAGISTLHVSLLRMLITARELIQITMSNMSANAVETNKLGEEIHSNEPSKN